MHLASAAVHSEGGGSVIVDSLFIVALSVCGSFVFGPCFLMQYLTSFLVLQLSRWGRESWLLYFNCHFDAMWLFVFCVSLTVLWVGLQCVIGAFPGHTHLLFAMYASTHT